MSIRPVLLIRPDANERDAAALDAHGVPSTIEPWLRVEPADADGARRVAGRLDAAGPQTVLAVTSPRTWRFWSRQVGAAELAAAASAAVGRGMRVYATGRATGSSLPPALARRVRCAATGAALAELILAETPDAVTAPVALLPGSAAGRSDLPDALAAAGWQVVRAGVYRTATASCRPVSADLLVQGAFSAVVLRSPSAVAALRTFVGDVPADVALVAAGPTTARAGREAGLTVAECAG
ncbi:MAG: uroporphyrinogen-III synthase, partial [Micrococcales bacterium]|nr:uroporphyrinogen-III synthase [Micrococcales bacterium]